MQTPKKLFDFLDKKKEGGYLRLDESPILTASSLCRAVSPKQNSLAAISFCPNAWQENLFQDICI